ncbi:hypothetical protein J1N35_039129 [Gossypium stocksii]|uniref:Uncharacterized protein n=1 Tax=Gossypium stocksii TaxID=47602 RepID=A0A9D3UNR1_9ROSI|nr:hypothetical protein J1N35_039129 [Gossypium stocksii]
MADNNFSVATLQQTLCTPMACETPKATPQPLTPFSAVVPAPFIAVHRLHIDLTLETIHEEENEEEINMELPQNSSSTDMFSLHLFLRSEEPLAVM